MRIETPTKNKTLTIEVVPGLLAGQPPRLNLIPEGVSDPTEILCILNDAQTAVLQQIAMIHAQERQNQMVWQLAATPLRGGQQP